VFVSAALLFMVQPMYARMVLPRLGGSPAVWNTALVFYQAMLLAGYLYAHFLVSRLNATRQTLLHLALVAVVLFALPITVPAGWSPPVGNPIPALLGLFLLQVGLPFFVVSTTGPLLQRWFSTTSHRAAADPYFLYAASNLGSLIGLVSYPILVEPNLRLSEQSRMWQLGYLALGLLVAGCAVALRRAAARVPAPAFASLGAAASESAATTPSPPIDLRRKVRWILLAFVPSSLMMSVTTLMSADIAAIPLLWVIPLSIYLLTFIVAFAKRPPIPHGLALRMFPFAIVLVTVVLMARASSPLAMAMAVHFSVLFVAAMACHGELAKDRPPPERLTEFYLWLAVGGVLGGAFNALLAPRMFTQVTEYPITLFIACLLVPPAMSRPAGSRARVLDVVVPVGMGVLLTALVLTTKARGFDWNIKVTAVLASVFVFVLFAFRRRPLRFALGFAALVMASPIGFRYRDFVIYAERGFFGFHRVEWDLTGHFHELYHGTTLHGLERVSPPGCREPLGYYSRSGPMADVFAALRTRPRRLNIATAGLGAGALAAYGDPGDAWTFYEIDPAVQRIASEPRLFCYLSESPAHPKVVLGDARLSLAAASERYDLIVLDAYSSDAIPVHLLTKEALLVYLDRLAPGGLIAFHVSSRYFALAPVVASLAKSTGLKCRIRNHEVLTKGDLGKGFWPSEYAVLARDSTDFGPLAADRGWKNVAKNAGGRVWTDDYSSLWAALRR
jgi:hypothetical protein